MRVTVRPPAVARANLPRVAARVCSAAPWKPVTPGRPAGARRYPYRLLLLGCVALGTAMLVGCDSAVAAPDMREQIVAFLHDFARQALAAWLF
jgi:hypothetical protein